MVGKHRIVFNIALFAVMLLTALLYLKTMLPSVGFWDTAEFQTIPQTLDIGHPPGYPSFILLGKIFLTIFPLGTVAWKMNLFSLLCMLLALFFAYKILFSITKDKFISMMVIPVLGLSSGLYWQMALQADPHSLHMLFVSLIIYLMIEAELKKDVGALQKSVFLTGLSLGNHLLSIFIIPELVISFISLIIKNKPILRIKMILKTVASFISGISIYLVIFVLGISKESFTTDYQINTLENFKRHIFGQDFQSQMGHWTKGGFLESFIYFRDILIHNLPVWIVIVSLVGLVWLIKKQRNIFIIFISINLLTVFFSLQYQNGFLERYFLVNIWSIAILGFIGLAWIIKLFPHINHIKYGLLMVMFVITIAQRVPDNYKKNDQSRNLAAYDYGMQALEAIPPGSYVLTWWSYATPIWYLQKVENINPTVVVLNKSKHEWKEIITDLLDQGKQVYLTELPDEHSLQYKLLKIGNIYKAVKN